MTESPQEPATISIDYREPEPVPEQTYILALDIDKSLSDTEGHWDATMVQSSIVIFNQVMMHARYQKLTRFVPSFVTLRSAAAFLDEDSPLYAYLHGGLDRSINDLNVVACEFGAVMLTRDPNNADVWHKTVDPEYESFVNGPRKIIQQIIEQEFIKNGPYQFERGQEVMTSLQKLVNGSPGHFDEGEREAIVETIKKKLVEAGHDDILQQVVFDINGNDVDIIPKSLFEKGKLVGLENILKELQKGQVPEANMSQVIMLDDSFVPVRQAFPKVVAHKGKIIAPANAKEELRALLADHGGFVADHPVFMGALQGIWHAAFDENLIIPWAGKTPKK